MEEKETSVKKSRKRKNKKKSKKELALGNTSQTEVLQPRKEAIDEKVKVKADLRSKISELELAEEAGKLKISTSIEEENARSSAMESKIKIASERNDHLRAKVDDINSEIERLLEEKRSVAKEQEGISPQSCTETDFETKTSNFVLFLLISALSVHFRAIYDETIRYQA